MSDEKNKRDILRQVILEAIQSTQKGDGMEVLKGGNKQAEHYGVIPNMFGIDHQVDFGEVGSLPIAGTNKSFEEMSRRLLDSGSLKLMYDDKPLWLILELAELERRAREKKD